jgi:hypothetical protein
MPARQGPGGPELDDEDLVFIGLGDVDGLALHPLRDRELGGLVADFQVGGQQGAGSRGKTQGCYSQRDPLHLYLLAGY